MGRQVLVDVSKILEAFRPWAENGEDHRHGLESCRRLEESV